MTTEAQEARDDRVTEAAARIAAAYLRFNAEQDGEIRALQALGEFQSFWNSYGSSFAPRLHADGAVPVTGMLDAGTGLALATSLASANHVAASAGAVPVTDPAGWYRRHLARTPLGSPLFELYRAGSAVNEMQTGGEIGSRAFAFIEQIPSPAPGGPILEPRSPGSIYEMDPIDIRALAPRRTLISYWPWAVGGIAALTLAGVLFWRIWGKGRRR